MWSPLILEKYIPKPLTVRALFFCVTAKALTKSISVASVASVSGVYKGKPGVIKGKESLCLRFLTFPVQGHVALWLWASPLIMVQTHSKTNCLSYELGNREEGLESHSTP